MPNLDGHGAGADAAHRRGAFANDRGSGATLTVAVVPLIGANVVLKITKVP